MMLRTALVKEKIMFTLVLYYPYDSYANGESETIQSPNIPQIGQTIKSEVYYHRTWVVSGINQDIVNGALSSAVGVSLKEDE